MENYKFYFILQIYINIKNNYGTINNIYKSVNFKFNNSIEFFDIVLAYLIIVYIMFGPNYMNIVSNISLFIINKFQNPIGYIDELWIILESLVRGKKLNYYEIGIFLKCIIFASLGLLFLFGATKLPVVGKILNKVKGILGMTTTRLISGKLIISGTIIYEILTLFLN